MRVLLIRPPATAFKKEPALIISEPLGLLYLAGYLKKYKPDVVVKIIDGYIGDDKTKEGDFYRVGLSYEAVRNKIREFLPDIVGVNCMFTEYSKGAHDIARITKEISKNILVVFGGAHACSFYEKILRDPNVDLVVKQEGEETLLELVQRRENGQDLQDVAGTVTKSNAGIKVNLDRPLIKDMDSIPFPARELLEMGDYYNYAYSVQKAMAYPRLSMVTSRGCPFRCVFCSIHSIWQHSYRARSPKNVVDEIESLCRNYHTREIIFFDDNMTLDRIRINGICDELIKRKLKVRWSTPNGVAIWTLDKPTIAKMKQAGCYKITFGLESGSLNTLKFIHKDFIDFKKAKELIRFSNRIGLWTISSFIIGFPYETREDITKTFSFALDSDVDMASFYCATAYPGSELFDICKKDGLIADLGPADRLAWIAETGQAIYDMKYLTKVEISFLRLDLQKRFLKGRCRSFLNPFRILRKLRGWDEIRYFIKMLKNYFPTLRGALRWR